MKRPNILLIMTDQQRGDCLGVEGHPCLLTPSMDALAASGMRFRRAYSTCPVCIPARRSLMSGLHPATHGMVGYADGQEWNPPATLPQLLREAGYQTALVGRNMHLYPHRKRYGFQEMTVSGTFAGNDYDAFLRESGVPASEGYYSSGIMHNDWTVRTWPLPEHLHRTNWSVNEALRFLRKRDPSCPWFLTVSFTAPHQPLVPPAFYFERYLRAQIPEPVIGDWAERPVFPGGAPSVSSSRVDLQGEALLSCRAAYYAMINHVDDQIRRLFSEFNGYDPANTLVVFTSDHGEMLGDHYFFRKQLPYEGAARIPFLLRLPGAAGDVPRGEVSNLPVCLEDLMPTLLDAAGVGVPEWVEGRSLLPVLRGDRVRGWREFLHIENSGGLLNFHALTDGREKYVWASKDGREQLFDLCEDPEETQDLSGNPAWGRKLAGWRERLVKTIAKRPEKFVKRGRLVPGRSHEKLVPAS